MKIVPWIMLNLSLQFTFLSVKKICSILIFLFAKWVTICKKNLDNRTHVLVYDWYFQSYLGLRISLVNHLESVLVLRMKNLYKNAQARWGTKLENQEVKIFVMTPKWSSLFLRVVQSCYFYGGAQRFQMTKTRQK